MEIQKAQTEGPSVGRKGKSLNQPSRKIEGGGSQREALEKECSGGMGNSSLKTREKPNPMNNAERKGRE